MGFGVLTQYPGTAFFFLVLAGIGVYAPFGVWWSYPTTFLSGTAAAGAVGLINSFGNLGGFVGPYLTGAIKASTGSFTAAWVALACSLTLAGLLILTFNRQRPIAGAQANTTRKTA
jgi:ACS family tartrate transporter-like MFS transporter